MSLSHHNQQGGARGSSSAPDAAACRRCGAWCASGVVLQVREGASYTQETRKIILSLERIRKVAPNGKEVLNNVSLGEWSLTGQALIKGLSPQGL